MKPTRILSCVLSALLVVMLFLSSNLEARAAALWATPSNMEPEIYEESLVPDLMAIEDRELVPLTEEEMEFIRNYNEEPLSEESALPEYVPQGKGRSAVVISQAVAALMALLFSSFGSTLEVSEYGAPNTIYKNLKYYSQKGPNWNDTIKFIYVGTAVVATVTLDNVKKFLNKIEESEVAGGGVSLPLDEEDKITLLYILIKSGMATSLEPEHVNVKALDGFSNYYIYTNYYSSDDCYVLYSSMPISFGVYNSAFDQINFYAVNNAAVEPLQLLMPSIANYKLDYGTGLYEFHSISGTMKDFGDAGYVSPMGLRCLPFNFVRNAASHLHNYISGTNLLGNLPLVGKVMTVSSIMNLGDIEVKGSILNYTSTDKNMYGLVSPLNPAAGAVIPKPATGEGEDTDKPGTGGGTGGGTGSGSADLSGIKNELSLIKGILSTIQANINLNTIAVNSLLAEVKEIKAALKDLSIAGSPSLDLVDALKNLSVSIEGINQEIAFANEIITSIDENLAYTQETISSIDKSLAQGQELITSIDVSLAIIPKLITDIKSELAVLSKTLGDVFDIGKDIPGSIAGVGDKVDRIPGAIAGAGADVGAKVDALPKDIADTISGAMANDLEKSQTVSGWGIFGAFQNKFPFSIPWDIVGCITLLKADPIKPVWEIPFVVDSPGVKINEKVVIDLSTKEWDFPVQVVRGFILLIFIFALALVTRGLIKG